MSTDKDDGNPFLTCALSGFIPMMVGGFIAGVYTHGEEAAIRTGMIFSMIVGLFVWWLWQTVKIFKDKP
jgi:Na+/proline symporter